MLETAKPILFNTDMVRAILESRKTETRRPINPRYKNDEYGFQICTNKATGEWWVEKSDDDGGGFENPRYINPPYQPGDILYVREKFNNSETDSVLYAADKDFIDFGCKKVDEFLFMESEIKWSPSIHMPKEAARIFLRVTDVRVERVQDITEEEAKAEGTTQMEWRDSLGNKRSATHKESFNVLWDSIYKTRGYGWDLNPFVWVIKFERLEAK